MILFVHAHVHKRVDEGDKVVVPLMRRVRVSTMSEQLDLVQCRIGVSAGRLHDLESDVLVRPVVKRNELPWVKVDETLQGYSLVVFGEPDSAEVAPAHLA